MLFFVRSKIFFLAFFLFSFTNTLVSQVTKISGRVIDADTKEPVPFVSIYFKNTTIATTSNVNGYYTIETDSPTDSLIISCVGYNKSLKKVIKNKTQIINVDLKLSQISLGEVVILPGENPAHPILKKIIENKQKNNKDKLSGYQYEVYNKLEFDVDNITENFKKKKILKPFNFIFDNIDSSSTSGKAFLPFFITETVSNFYFRKNPMFRKEIISASKVSGIENESVSQFLGSMYQEINIYENYINILDKGFISPINNNGLFFYRYYLVDSLFWDNDWCYKIEFKPRRKQELTFLGHFWVHDTSFAIKKIEMRISDDANVNFVDYALIKQEFDQVEDTVWMLIKDHLVVDFIAPKNSVGLIGRKSTSYNNFVINEPKDEKFFLSSDDIVVLDSAFFKTHEFWQTARHDSLTQRENAIYNMIDTIKSIPVFRTYIDIIELFVTGYKIVGKFELGPYFTTYSTNTVEGSRFRVGARTSNAFSTKYMMEAYTAYGIKDNKFKYGFELKYFFTKRPRQMIGISYKDDIEQSGQNEIAFREDNILSSILRRSPSIKLTTVKEEKIYLDKEWWQGLSTQLTLTHRDINPEGNFDFSYYTDPANDGIKRTLNTSEVIFSTRFAYREKFVEGEFERASLGTSYPILQLKYILGLKGVLKSDFNYHKIIFGVDDKVPLNPLGYTHFIFQAGKIWGTLPYPLLEVHKGNETYVHNYLAFNLMNYYEFISDSYMNLFITHHFNGLFFNQIPLLRKLKWRSLASFVAVVGRVDQDNKNILVVPNTFYSLNKPYSEVGVGIENIFSIFRIDAIWRLSYLDNPGISKFGVRGSLQFSF